MFFSVSLLIKRKTKFFFISQNHLRKCVDTLILVNFFLKSVRKHSQLKQIFFNHINICYLDFFHIIVAKYFYFHIYLIILDRYIAYVCIFKMNIRDPYEAEIKSIQIFC